MAEERSRNTGKLVAVDNSEAMMALAEASTSTKSLLTQEGAPGNLWQRHRNEFAKLSQYFSVIRACTKAGFMKPVTEGQYFMTIRDEVTYGESAGLCREYTRPRDEADTRVKGWIWGNTKMGPALEVTATNHLRRYRVEIKL